MQRVELLVWRDFVNLIRRRPDITAAQVSDKLNMERSEAEEYIILYRRFFRSRIQNEPNIAALAKLMNRHPLPIDNLQPGEKAEICISSDSDSITWHSRLNNRAKSFRKYGYETYKLCSRRVGNKLIVERIR